MREVEFGGPYDLVMLLSGELNVFRPDDASEIVRRAATSLAAGGKLLVEVSTHSATKARGIGNRWYWRRHGLWSDAPHGVIEEAAWDEQSQATIVRYFVVSADMAVRLYSATYQAYSTETFRELLNLAGVGRAQELRAWPAGSTDFVTYIADSAHRP
jgi:hypothetical protein